ncbi:MAG: protease complex subunit PrcB family protein [Anaerolineales bacterium]|nr:protease complex subunit PrcB family protein [Anaerolineales bacterium]
MKYARITILLGSLLLVIAACRPQEPGLHFKSIAQRDIINYREKSPTLIIIANDDEIDAPVSNVLVEDLALADLLRQLDYDRVFAILVLQGLKGVDGYSATVQRIVREDDQVNVYAEFITPDPGTRRMQVFTSPYHLIAVSKLGKWGQQIKFVLVVDDQPIVEINHLIP